ncbi:MAG: hypothetical protein OJF59_001660 [Cytophagales bacterium]|jgi:hypothetical protein|nr:hypothetical protein [Bacteroidota bacterium]MBS1980585.1 hypothetical protein [Bacteroidota bacterium]WHZ07907.1 MAG: hypothetical protein OJF59_001660 [Cytophagales bacterium]
MSFLEKRTRRALKKNKSVRNSVPYKQAQQVGVLFSVEDKQKHLEIKEFVHQLEQDGKKVQVLEYLPLKAENYEFMFDFFTIKDLSFWGEIKSDIAQKFSDTPFDYLYYIDRESNPLAINLLANSKAKCRVGRYREVESDFFELMIEQNGTNKGLMDTMLKYTKQLR